MSAQPVDVLAYESAYPGSMSVSRDGDFVRIDDARSLAGALLRMVDGLRREANGTNDALGECEATRAELMKQAKLAFDFCDLYASFIRDYVRADDLELHPYLPAVEGVVTDGRAALARCGGAS